MRPLLGLGRRVLVRRLRASAAAARPLSTAPLSPPPSLADMPLDQWAALFREEVLGVAAMDMHTVGYQESAERLRAIVQSGLLLHTDLVDRPERFFLAHRLLAEHTPKLGPGFWIR